MLSGQGAAAFGGRTLPVGGGLSEDHDRSHPGHHRGVGDSPAQVPRTYHGQPDMPAEGRAGPGLSLHKQPEHPTTVGDITARPSL